MKLIKMLVKVLLLVGGLNWGLVGAFNYDLVAMLLGDMTMAARIVYCLVGLAAVAKICCCITHSGCCEPKQSCSNDEPKSGGCCGH